MFSGKKSWFQETIIKHPWEHVMESVQHKYPNPYSTSVLNIDIIHRKIDQHTGVMYSHKLINSSWPMFPQLGQLKALECSVIDANERKMLSFSRNFDLTGILKAVEHIEYSVHPDNCNWTLFKHSVSVDAFALIALTALSASKQAASQGREALQWVIDHRLPLLPSFTPTSYVVPDSFTHRQSSVIVPSPSITLLGSSTSSVNLNRSTRNMFFADQSLPAATASTATTTSMDRLGASLESFSLEVTTMSNALVRRCQRVAKLFSGIDEYVLIM